MPGRKIVALCVLHCAGRTTDFPELGDPRCQPQTERRKASHCPRSRDKSLRDCRPDESVMPCLPAPRRSRDRTTDSVVSGLPRQGEACTWKQLSIAITAGHPSGRCSTCPNSLHRAAFMIWLIGCAAHRL